MALFYGDYFARDSKSGGARMDVFVEQSTLREQRPVIYNVCNYTRPQCEQSALLSWDEVITLFHEFGHALHGLFANQRYASLSGTNTPRDFCRVPVANLRTLGQPSAGVCPLCEALSLRRADAGGAARQYVACGNFQ